VFGGRHAQNRRESPSVLLLRIYRLRVGNRGVLPIRHLGRVHNPQFSVGGTSLNLAELVAAIFGAATIVALYLRYVEEERAKAAVPQPQKPARGAPKRRRRAS
jgi:hypothetical protein